LRTFKQQVQAENFVITAELHLREDDVAREIARQADILKSSVCAIHVPENADRLHGVSAMAASALLLHNGVDPIPELSCGGRNRIALMSDLLGLRALGITSLVIRPDSTSKPEACDGITKISGTDCRTLIELADTLNQDEVSLAEGFLIGTDSGPFSVEAPWDEAELKSRAAAGARILQTPLCLDMDSMRSFMQRLVDTRLTWSYSTIVGMAALPSVEVALSLSKLRPGTLIPETILERLSTARHPEQEGIDICAALIREVSTIPGISGVRLLTLGNPENSLQALKLSGIRD